MLKSFDCFFFPNLFGSCKKRSILNNSISVRQFIQGQVVHHLQKERTIARFVQTQLKKN